jgi:hypothetical protein
MHCPYDTFPFFPGPKAAPRPSSLPPKYCCIPKPKRSPHFWSRWAGRASRRVQAIQVAMALSERLSRSVGAPPSVDGCRHTAPHGARKPGELAAPGDRGPCHGLAACFRTYKASCARGGSVLCPPPSLIPSVVLGSASRARAPAQDVIALVGGLLGQVLPAVLPWALHHNHGLRTMAQVVLATLLDRFPEAADGRDDGPEHSLRSGAPAPAAEDRQKHGESGSTGAAALRAVAAFLDANADLVRLRRSLEPRMRAYDPNKVTGVWLKGRIGVSIEKGLLQKALSVRRCVAHLNPDEQHAGWM